MVPRFKATGHANGPERKCRALSIRNRSSQSKWTDSPDYQESRGAMVEWAYCQRIGKDCAMYLDMKKGE